MIHCVAVAGLLASVAAQDTWGNYVAFGEGFCRGTSSNHNPSDWYEKVKNSGSNCRECVSLCDAQDDCVAIECEPGNWNSPCELWHTAPQATLGSGSYGCFIRLRDYLAAPASDSQPNYCDGEYSAFLSITDVFACAAECDARGDCVHFAVCADRDSDNCCRLSTSCRQASSVSPDWDGYFKILGPTPMPSAAPTQYLRPPTSSPSSAPTVDPTTEPSTSSPSLAPTSDSTTQPPTSSSSSAPTTDPTTEPSTSSPSSAPTSDSTTQPPTSSPSSPITATTPPTAPPTMPYCSGLRPGIDGTCSQVPPTSCSTAARLAGGTCAEHCSRPRPQETVQRAGFCFVRMN